MITGKITGFLTHENGDKNWYNNGKLHREYGPAIELADGHKEWYFNGLHHRVNGPAIEWNNGEKAWYLNGLRHRADGPAVERADGVKQWWLNDKFIKTNTKQLIETKFVKVFV